jgi:hypothetical protein
MTGLVLVDRFDRLKEYPACRHHVMRATAYPSFVAHFAAAD